MPSSLSYWLILVIGVRRAVPPETRFLRLAELVRTAPDFLAERSRSRLSDETLQWLGRLYALVDAAGERADAAAVRLATSNLEGPEGWRFDAGERTIRTVLFRNFAMAELYAPSGMQGRFIAAGSAFEALAAITKLFKLAEADLFIIDPYLDGSALTEFVVLAPETVIVRLLADSAFVKSGLKPAYDRWISQWPSRPLSARLASSRTLHDRVVILDNKNVFLLSQSLNGFAARSPATVTPADLELASLKVDFYNSVWDRSSEL